MVKAFKKRWHVFRCFLQVPFWREISVADNFQRHTAKCSKTEKYRVARILSRLISPCLCHSHVHPCSSCHLLGHPLQQSQKLQMDGSALPPCAVFFCSEHEYSTALTGQMIIYSFIADGWSTWIWKNKHRISTIVSNTVCALKGIGVVLLRQQMASSLGDNTHWILVFVATAYRGH